MHLNLWTYKPVSDTSTPDMDLSIFILNIICLPRKLNTYLRDWVLKKLIFKILSFPAKEQPTSLKIYFLLIVHDDSFFIKKIVLIFLAENSNSIFCALTGSDLCASSFKAFIFPLPQKS